MPYIRKIGYIRTGPRPRVRKEQIERHNASLGTSSTGYSLRTRPDNYCLQCQNRWVPRGKNLSNKCPNCKKSSVVSSRELFEPRFPFQPKKPKFFSNFYAYWIILFPLFSFILLVVLFSEQDFSSINPFGIGIFIGFVVILNIIVVLILKKKAKAILFSKITNWGLIMKNWEKFCKVMESNYNSWLSNITSGFRQNFHEFCWDYSNYNWERGFGYIYYS
jgi:hypothetical protein